MKASKVEHFKEWLYPFRMRIAESKIQRQGSTLSESLNQLTNAVRKVKENPKQWEALTEMIEETSKEVKQGFGE